MGFLSSTFDMSLGVFFAELMFGQSCIYIFKEDLFGKHKKAGVEHFSGTLHEKIGNNNNNVSSQA